MSISFFGTILVDIVLQDLSEKLEHESLYASRYHQVFPGGKALNQAACASTFGEKAVLFAKHGEDPNGAFVRVEIEKKGVLTDCLITDHALPTGFVVLVPKNGDYQSLVVSYGASLKLSEFDYEKIKETFLKSSIVVGGLELNLSLVKRILFDAKERGKLIILDPYPPEKADTEVLALADIITPNRDEGAVISGRDIKSIFAAKLAVRDLLKIGIKNVCLKLGEDGIVIGTKDDIIHITPVKVQSVDATGGGDVFAGLLSVLLKKGIDIITAAEIANYASALSVTSKGAFTSIPTKASLHEFMLHRNADERLIKIVEEHLLH
jgi:ribokinase